MPLLMQPVRCYCCYAVLLCYDCRVVAVTTITDLLRIDACLLLHLLLMPLMMRLLLRTVIVLCTLPLGIVT